MTSKGGPVRLGNFPKGTQPGKAGVWASTRAHEALRSVLAFVRPDPNAQMGSSWEPREKEGKPGLQAQGSQAA